MLVESIVEQLPTVLPFLGLLPRRDVYDEILFCERWGNPMDHTSELAFGITTDHTNTEFVWVVVRTAVGGIRFPRNGGTVRANRSPPFGMANNADINWVVNVENEQQSKPTAEDKRDLANQAAYMRRRIETRRTGSAKMQSFKLAAIWTRCQRFARWDLLSNKRQPRSPSRRPVRPSPAEEGGVVVARGGEETPPAAAADKGLALELPPGPSSEMLATRLHLDDLRKELTVRKTEKKQKRRRANRYRATAESKKDKKDERTPNPPRRSTSNSDSSRSGGN